MKKIIFMFALVVVFGGFASSTSAAICGDPSQSTLTTTYITCGNGPIVAQQPGGRFLKPGVEDCPAWFPYFGCYTMRALNSYFIPLN